MRYGRFKKAVSGFLAAMTIMTTVFSPLSAYAAEVPPEEPKPPLYEEVKDQLDVDEVVKAEDLELEYGCNFDAKTDFSNIEIPDNEKVKVTFEEAKNESGEEFTTQKSDSYKAVYYVQPLKTEHPKYQISRKLIVKEAPQTEQETETPIEAAEDGNSSESGEEQSDDGLVDIQMPEEAQPVVIEQETPSDEEVSTEEETAEVTEAPAESATEEITEAPEESEPEKTTEIPMEEATKDFSEGLSEEEFDEALEEAENQETYDQETGLDLEIVLTAARDQDIDLFALEEGESVEFYVEAPSLIVTYAASTTKKVTITRGSWYYYADYGLGSYQTAPYKVKYGNVSATAYCVQPSKRGPDDGTYKITKLSDGKSLAKVCYYGTKASGDDGFFAEKHPDFSAGKRFIITHMAAAYANGSSDAFSGTNSTGKSLAMELYNYCMSQPEIPEVDMAFSNPNVTAYVDGKQQRTEEVTFLADTLQSITFKLPAGVKFHNVTTGKTSAAGASVEINGGTKFYLSAPITQAADVSATFSATMKGTIVKDYSAYKISTGGDLQDLAFVFGEAVDDEKYVDFSVTWVSQASVSIVKKDKKTNAAVAGAVYGLYSDPDCTNLIMEMPATDANGASSVTLNKTQDMIYLKEISGPTGYLLDTAVHNIQLVVGKTSNQVVTDEEQKANLTIYKEGEVLTGANVTEEGVSFVYEKRRQKGAVYNVYAAADIKRADGTVVYKQGALVKENLATGDDGSATLKGLYLGTYRVTEMKAPTNLICAGESKEVTLSYAGQNVEVAVGDLTFVNDRQKAKVFAEKQDKDTKKSLAGAVFGLYAGKDIKNQDGQVVVAKDTLIAKATTDEMGSGAFAADIPNNNSYYVKELQAPANYFRNSDEVYSFDFLYTNDKEATVSFSHTFSNEHVSASIHLVKKDKETGNVTQGDAKFAGAVYGVYARENIAHPDGKSGVLYTIYADNIDSISYYREHPLVLEAIQELRERFPDFKYFMTAQEKQDIYPEHMTAEAIAYALVDLAEDFDTYEFRDNVDDKETLVKEIEYDLYAGRGKKEYSGFLKDVMDESDELSAKAQVLLQRINDYSIPEKKDLEPMVKIVFSEYREMETGKYLPFKEANEKLGALDQTFLKENQASDKWDDLYSVGYMVLCSIDSEIHKVTGKIMLGTGEGDIIEHMKGIEDQRDVQEHILPYLYEYCGLVEKSPDIATEVNEKEPAADHKAVQSKAVTVEVSEKLAGEKKKSIHDRLKENKEKLGQKSGKDNPQKGVELT